MKKLLFITPEDAEYGFSLAGAAQRVVKPEGLREALRQTLRAVDGVGLVAVDERLAKEGLSQPELEELRQAYGGMLVIMPAPATRAGVLEEDYAAELIRRTIGYHMRITE